MVSLLLKDLGWSRWVSIHVFSMTWKTVPENEPSQRKTKLRAARDSPDYITGVPWIQPCLKPNNYMIPALGPVHFPFASTPLNLGSCHLNPESQPTQSLISRTARSACNVATSEAGSSEYPTSSLESLGSCLLCVRAIRPGSWFLSE